MEPFVGRLMVAKPWPRLEVMPNSPFSRKVSGGKLMADGDDRVLLHVPEHFDAAEPFGILLFLHGFFAVLSARGEGRPFPTDAELAKRDKMSSEAARPYSVDGDYRLPAQIDASGANVVLVAPQFMRNGSSSSVGRLATPAGANAFLASVRAALATMTGDTASLRERFAAAPVFLSGYSGGGQLVSALLAHDDVAERVKGVLLLDGPYMEASNVPSWFVEQAGAAFVACAHTMSIAAFPRNDGTTVDFAMALRDGLAKALKRAKLNIVVGTKPPDSLRPGVATVFKTRNGGHFSFVRTGWPDGEGPIRRMLELLSPDLKLYWPGLHA